MIFHYADENYDEINDAGEREWITEEETEDGIQWKAWFSIGARPVHPL